VLQAVVPVLTGDTRDALAARVAQQEHRIYPRAVSLFAAGRLRMQDNAAWLDGEPLGAHGLREVVS
jgi:phosphoribosylglycinamide formyltransferase-1